MEEGNIDDPVSKKKCRPGSMREQTQQESNANVY